MSKPLNDLTGGRLATLYLYGGSVIPLDEQISKELSVALERGWQASAFWTLQYGTGCVQTINMNQIVTIEWDTPEERATKERQKESRRVLYANQQPVCEY